LAHTTRLALGCPLNGQVPDSPGKRDAAHGERALASWTRRRERLHLVLLGALD